MKDNISVAVIGGTGKSGKYLVSELINKGYHLKVLVRNPENFKIKNELVEIVPGNVSEYQTVKTLMVDCSTVISTLGWGNPPSPNTIFSLATQNILRAMGNLGISRYIVVSGLHVDTPEDKKSAQVKMATAWMYENYRASTQNRQLEFEILAASELDWTLVRLPRIELTTESRKTSVSIEDCPGDKISAVDLANFLIEQIDNRAFVGKAPFLANI